MPFLQEEIPVLYNDLTNLSKLVAAKTPIARQTHRLQPELRVSTRVSHMYVRRLATLQAEKEESVSTDPQQRGHYFSLP
jgi:hypothetical protein